MIRINAIFDEPLLKQMSHVAKEEHISRSELIRKALKDYLARHTERHRDALRKKSLADAFMVQDALRQKAGSWDGTAVIRRWRDNT